jgi:hypothetical protein
MLEEVELDVLLKEVLVVLAVVLVVLVKVVVAVEVGSAARISASMLSKSSSVCAVATAVARCLPFLLLFGILVFESAVKRRRQRNGGREERH